ncbi:MAG: DUF3127 domain-containing protein [Bacteroidia bacterium]
MFELTGIIKLKKDEQKVSDSFKKREFVVTDNSSNYPQHILFQLTQERCRLLDEVNVGDQVKVSFFIRGREWQGKDGGGVKYFTSLDAWRVERTSGSSESQAAPASFSSDSNNSLSNAAENDDLPF